MTEQVCLNCGVAGPTVPPGPGRRRAAVCHGCGHLMGVNEDGSFRALTDDEMVELAGDPRVVGLNSGRERTEFSAAAGAKESLALSDRIWGEIRGINPDVIAGALGGLVATHFGGFVVEGDEAGTLALRDQLLTDFVDLVRQLIAIPRGKQAEAAE